MCKPTAPPRRKASLLLTTESFNYDDDSSGSDGKADGKGGHGPAPPMSSTFFTLSFLVGFLVGIELAIRWVLERFQDYHPILGVEVNRQILARHIGVDVVGCASVAIIGLRNRHIIRDMIPGGITFGRADSMPEAGYEARLFTYHPAAQHVLLFFFAYQVKNMFDSIVWNDGIVFILHHLLSGAAAWGGMFPGSTHYYAIFFMGISEVSTAILCMLANFDDEHGVVGLGDAFPLAKVVLGVVFAVAFIICRSVLWPFVTYYFVRDARNAIKSDSPRSRSRRGWLRLFVFSCAGLSILQVLWLGEIIMTLKEEVSKMM